MFAWLKSVDRFNPFTMLHPFSAVTFVNFNNHYSSIGNGALVGLVHHHTASTVPIHITTATTSIPAIPPLFLFSLTVSIVSILLCSIRCSGFISSL